MALTFAWDPKKAASNLKKHKVSFEEASTVFNDLLSVTAHDPDHSQAENRLLIVGVTARGRLVIVSFVERGKQIRLISARLLTRREREQYEESKDRRR